MSLRLYYSDRDGAPSVGSSCDLYDLVYSLQDVSCEDDCEEHEEDHNEPHSSFGNSLVITTPPKQPNFFRTLV
jgi:hypothetical protein